MFWFISLWRACVFSTEMLLAEINSGFFASKNWAWLCAPRWALAAFLLVICQNYTSVDPKQFRVSKFRLKPVILISECFCSRCGHTNQHPPPHEGRQPETMGDNGRQDHFRAQKADHTNQHPPPTWRETTGDKGRQRETRPLQSPRSLPHQPTPRRPDLKLH